MTLKMEPKPNHLFGLSQSCIRASLMKFHLIQEMFDTNLSRRCPGFALIPICPLYLCVETYIKSRQADSIESQISSTTSRGKKGLHIKDITSDSQVSSNFPYRWSPASLTLNIYFYLFLYLTRITINNWSNNKVWSNRTAVQAGLIIYFVCSWLRCFVSSRKSNVLIFPQEFEPNYQLRYQVAFAASLKTDQTALLQ